jgi:hypothetical protein
MQKKLKFIFDGGDYGSKKCKRGYGGVWRESGVRQSVLSWCVWQESGFRRRQDVFTFNLLKKIFGKFCSFNTIFKDNDAVIFITVQYKKSLIPVKLTGHTLR